MRIALAQSDIVWEDKTANLAKAENFSSMAEAAKADIIVFPEMFLTGFTMSTVRCAERLDGSSIHSMRKIAERFGIFIIFGMPTSQDNKYYNTLFVLNRKGDIAAFYNKIHTFSFSGEHNAYANGKTQPIVNIDGASASTAICYDLRFPELFTHRADDKQVQFVIANWPRERDDHWRTLIKARALDSLSFLVAVNRVGKGNGLEYAGNSAVITPWGEIAGCCRQDVEELMTVEIDVNQVTDIRRKFAVLVDRKHEGYESISS
jgi:omega-amidase